MASKTTIHFLAGVSFLAESLSFSGFGIAADNELPETVGGLPVDTVSSLAIREATTAKKFLNDWVSVIPDHPTIPSPRDFLGHIAGSPGEMTNVDEIHAYMRAIAKATDRAQVVSLGQTEEAAK